MRKFILPLFVLMIAAPYLRAEDAFQTLLADWHDAKRNVDVPVKVYYPKDLKSPAPVVVVSHGLGGSREGLKYIGEYLAEHGYITVHPTHIGSDISIVRPGGARFAQEVKAGFTPKELQSRCQDVSFVIDELERLNADPKSQFAGKLDLKRVAMAGHSFGAITTEAICGGTMSRGLAPMPDPRITCGVAFSPSSPRTADPKAGLAGIKLPMLHLTGTDDDMSKLGGVATSDRRVPFDTITGVDQYLVILNGATHATLGGARRGSGTDQTPLLAIYQRVTLEFLNAYDGGDDKAKIWLQKDAKALVGDHGTFEMKVK